MLHAYKIKFIINDIKYNFTAKRIQEIEKLGEDVRVIVIGNSTSVL